MHKILFDTDPGIDDAMALLFAHRSPEIEIVGVTSVVGNASIETTTRNALYLCERYGIDAPIAQGAAQALVVPTGAFPDFVHGADGLGNTAPSTPIRQVAEQNAAQFIVDTVKQSPGEITLVAVGRLTNIALAMSLDPTIIGEVREIVIMGGALGVGPYTGNVSPVAEANIAGDPHAADLVFSGAWPVTMVGLDVTMETRLSEAGMLRLRESGGDLGSYLYEITRFYAAFYQGAHDFDGFPVHDSSAIAYLLKPELYSTVTGAMRVVTDGVTAGQTVMVSDPEAFPASAFSGMPAQKACVGVQADAVIEFILSTLCA